MTSTVSDLIRICEGSPLAWGDNHAWHTPRPWWWSLDPGRESRGEVRSRLRHERAPEVDGLFQAEGRHVLRSHAHRVNTFQVRPLHPVLGCKISGVTLAEAVSPAIFAKVYEAFLEYQSIRPRRRSAAGDAGRASRATSARCKSTCSAQYHGYKDHPEIYMLSNLDEDGNPSGKHPDKGTLCSGTPTARGASAPGKRR